MSRKIKTLIITLGVLVLLGGAYYGSTTWKKKKDTPPPRTYEPSPRLGNLDSSKLVKIEIPGIKLEKKGDTWELVSLDDGAPPAGIELDQSQIRSLTYSLASIYIDRVVDEDPADLSIYGLDKPSSRAIIADSEGKTVEYIRGDMTPSRSEYYFTEAGDPKVYIISSYTAEYMNFNLDKIRVKPSFPTIDLMDLKEMRLELVNGTRIELSSKPESTPPYLASLFTAYLLTSPYRLTRGVDSEALSKILEPLQYLSMADFIDDNPSSLAPYGLDKPTRFFLRTEDDQIELLIGDRLNDKRYVKLPNSPGVFTLSGLDGLVDVRPFGLLDKFALLVNIDSVDNLTVTGGERFLNADFEGKGDEGVYFLNGKKADTKSFKTWYQAVIGLLSDAEIPAGTITPAMNPTGTGTPATGEITIEYKLNTSPGLRASITLVPYNRDFYALRQEGTMEFLISRNQVRKIWETADSMIFE